MYKRADFLTSSQKTAVSCDAVTTSLQANHLRTESCGVPGYVRVPGYVQHDAA